MASQTKEFHDVGIAMCFNAAKTWQSKWYEEYHEVVRPHRTAFSGKLVGINDVINDDNIQDDHRVVIRIRGGDEPDFFVMFQRQEGVNAGIPEDGNKVVITEQEFKSV